jgi:IclR family KDG regulon transcriptional repressor
LVDDVTRPRSESSAVKTVAKVLDILDQLGSVGRPVSVSEVATLTGINVSTAHRLLQTLTRRHYIEQAEDTRAYTLGPRLFELGSAYARNLDLVGAARPLIEQLRDATHETIHLALLRDRDVVEICTAGSRQAVTVTRGAGRRDPASCTATGKIMLASLAQGELERFLAQGPLPALTKRSITTCEALLADLDRVRVDGYAIDNQELSEDVCCIGVPVHGGGGRVVAALSIAMPRERFKAGNVPEWVRLLQHTAGRISDVVMLSGAG